MTKRRPPKKPVAPTTPEQGSTLMIAAAIPIFDPHDGHGADWKLMAESFFMAGFNVLNRLEEGDRQAFAQKIHQQTYDKFLSADPEAPEMDIALPDPPEPDEHLPAAVLAPRGAPK